MNPNLMQEISELRKIYNNSRNIYPSRGYSYKTRVRQCTFTNNLLKHPVVMCKRGFLFNRPSLLRALTKKNLPKRLKYIQSEEDLCEVNLNPNKKNRFPFCCPLTAKVLNGLNPFVLVWSCGCLMYEKLLFPLAGIKTKLERIIQFKESGDEKDPVFTEKKYKCPNCRTCFALENLFCLNLSSRKNVNSVSNKKDKSKGNSQNLGKRAEMEGGGQGSVERNNIGVKRVKRNENLGQNKDITSQKSKKAAENKKK